MVEARGKIVAWVTALVVVAGLSSLLVGAPTATAVEQGDLAAMERRVVELHNQARAERGLAPLAVSPVFSDTARAWSAQMAAMRSVEHQSTANGHTSYATVTCDASGLAWTWCAENLAAGQSGADAVHADWMASPDHHVHIVRPEATVMGVGAYRDSGGRIWWTARFAAAPDVVPTATSSAGSVDLARYVDEMHRVFLRRGATTTERERWLTALGSGVGRGELIAALATSDAWLGAEVDAIYQRALGRTPDAAGRRYWTETVRAGTRITELGVFVFASDELFGLLGNLPTAFVDQVHRQVLGRPATAVELVATTTRMLSGASRSDVVASVYASLESRAARVERLYRDILGRGAEAGGRAYWADELLRHDDVALAAHLAGSDEFFERATR